MTVDEDSTAHVDLLQFSQQVLSSDNEVQQQVANLTDDHVAVKYLILAKLLETLLENESRSYKNVLISNFDKECSTFIVNNEDESQQQASSQPNNAELCKNGEDNSVRVKIDAESKDFPNENNKTASDVGKVSKKLHQVVRKKILKHVNFALPSKPAEHKAEEDEESNCTMIYLKRMRGQKKPWAKIHVVDALTSFLTSFIGMAVLTGIDYYLLEPNNTSTLVIGSFAASAVLLFAAVSSPLAQPKNLLVGHVISALVGVAMQLALGQQHKWLAGALAVSVSIGLMCLTDTVHPPGGATALIAVYSDRRILDLKFWYVLLPVGAGCLLLLLIALLANNLVPWRRYPRHWN